MDTTPQAEQATNDAQPESMEQVIMDAAHELPTEPHEPAPETAPTEAVQPEVVQEAANEWQDRYLRLMAEFDNYRKRTNREKDDLVKYANENLLKALLPVVDDIKRTLKVSQTSDNLQALQEGVALVARNLTAALQKVNVEEISALDQPFDSNQHEAIANLPTDDPAKKGKVIDVIENGYTYQGKVVRFAKVITGE